MLRALINKIWPFRAKHQSARRGHMVRFGYDAAQTNSGNMNRYAQADGVSINAMNDPGTRKILRDRCRYVRANAPYANGVVNTFADDIIGTGPSLNMQTNDPVFNEFIEKEFNSWAEKIGLYEKLKLWAMAICDSGEAVGVLVTNDTLDTPVKLDLMEIECDRLTSGFDFLADDDDGITYDKYGKPASYKILDHHPDGLPFERSLKAQTFSAERVIHWFLPTRPGQHRGVPLMHPVVELFEQLRSYRTAVLTSAENAAMISAVLYNDMPQDASAKYKGSNDDPDSPNLLNLTFGSVPYLPRTWRLEQFKAEQPTTTHDAFNKTCLKEIGRNFDMTSNVVMGDSSDHNFASGRLDWQTSSRAVNVRRKSMEHHILNRILVMWMDEALLIPDYIQSPTPENKHQYSWFYDGREHVDPKKEADAQKVRIENNTTTLAIEYGKQGIPWDKALEQIAREKKKMKQLGITRSDIAAANQSPSESESEVSNAV